MRSVADGLRKERLDETKRLAPEDRLALALDLGESDLEMFRSASGSSRKAARAEIRARRRVGRVPSASIDAANR